MNTGSKNQKAAKPVVQRYSDNALGSKIGGEITKKELYEMIREQIKHEDELVNHRLNWLLLSQAFLFTAFIAIATNQNAMPHIGSDLVPYIPIGLAAIGFIINALSFIGINSAHNSLDELRNIWYGRYPEEKKSEEGVYANFPQITWEGSRFSRAINTATSTPLIISIIWIFLGYATLEGNDPYFALLAGMILISAPVIIIMLIKTFKK